MPKSDEEELWKTVDGVRVAIPSVPTYPEHEKQSKIVAESQAQGEFLDWLLNARGFTLAYWTTDGNVNDRLTPAATRTQDLLAEYHDIDLEKIESERRQMLEKLRNS